MMKDLVQSGIRDTVSLSDPCPFLTQDLSGSTVYIYISVTDLYILTWAVKGITPAAQVFDQENTGHTNPVSTSLL